MRQIYAATIEALETKPLPHRSPEDQYLWWQGLDHGMSRFFLYSPVEQPWEIVAFSMITRRGKYSTPMFAIHPFFHGRGYGREIIQHYIQEADGPLAGEQLVSNETIRYLNSEAGWNVVSSNGIVEKLWHPGPHADVDPMQDAYDEIIRYHGYRDQP